MDLRTPVKPQKLVTWLGLAIGITGLVLQLILSLQAYTALGKDVLGSLGTFFSFYTILTNIALVLIYLSEVTEADWLTLFRHPLTRGLMAANIAFVMLYVYFVLRHLAVLDGLNDLADRMLHYLGPILYLIWWLIAPRHGQLRLAHLPAMLAPTLVYFLYILVRGAWVHEYPYPVLNVDRIGYPAVLLNALYMTLGFAILSAIVILLDHAIARNSRTEPA